MPELEEKLHCKLHVPAFEVAAGEDTTVCRYETGSRVARSVSEAADVQGARYHEQIRVVEDVKGFKPKLHAVPLGELHAFV